VVIHHFLALFTQTFFHHRYAAHEMFTMSKFWEKTFFICSWLFQGSSYLSPRTYGKLHRLHHANTDTEKDVHSPRHDKTIWRMMNKTKNIYSSIHDGKTDVDPKITANLPEWKGVDKFAHSWGARLFLGLVYVAIYVLLYIQFDLGWWIFFLLPIHFLMSPIHGAIINWFAHRIGYRNHKGDDTSTNIFPVELLMLGEGLHNNHHKKSTSANFAQKWFEFDPVYFMILIMNGIGIIKLKKS
jgi:stearoyl-CoA desaturase (delta-9 desaturase)